MTGQQQNPYQSTKRNIIANFLSTLWTGIIGFLFIPLYVRYLGPESYGLVGLLITIQAWMTLLDMGLMQTLSREMARYDPSRNQADEIHDLLKSVVIIYAAVGGIACIAICLGADQIVWHWLNIENLSANVAIDAIRLIGVIIFLSWITALYKSAITGLQKQVWLSWSNTVFATLRGVGVLAILAWVSPTIQAFFLYLCFICLAELVVVRKRLRQYLPHPPSPPKFSLKALRSVWRFAFGVTVVTMLGVCLSQIDRILITKMLPLHEFGYYMMAMAVVSVIGMIYSPISRAVFPVFASLAKDDMQHELAKAYHKYSQLVALVAVPVAIVMSLFAEQFLMLWTRDAEIVGAISTVLSIYVIGTLLNGFMQLPALMFYAHGKTKLPIYVNLISILILTPSLYFSLMYMGMVGAAIVWAALNFCYFFVFMPLIVMTILPKEPRFSYLRDVMPTLLAVMTGLMIVKAMAPMPELNMQWSNFLTLVIAAIVAMALSVWATPISNDYLKNFVCRIRGRNK